MNRNADLFQDLRATAADRQMRMTRLQVFNWGTFTGLHDIPIAAQGFLFVGRSGSGKSTLLDAIAALLVPPQSLSFNTAAREGDGGRHDRNLASYVRGAWADAKDLESGEIATRYLRTGSTFSALAVSFENAEGRVVSLAQVYWLRGASNRNADVRRHYVVAERQFPLARELDSFNLDLRAFKQRLDDVQHFDRFRPYGERFRRLLHIDSELALKLLHKTQSAKNLGDLNVFLRDFMLEPPPTFKVAERLVAEFAELDAAHGAVVTARRQVETLEPARAAVARVSDIDIERARLTTLLEAMDGYRDRRRVTLLERECARIDQRDQELAGNESTRRERLDTLQAELELLRDRHREQGGGRIEELEHRRRESEQERERRVRRRNQLTAVCERLGWTPPDSAVACAALTRSARDELERRDQAGASDERERDSLRDRLREIEAAFAEARDEIEAMQRQPSNIPARMLALRRLLAEQLGIDDQELPFAGELMQVREDENDWRGAAERVLHGFALSLLVDERRYPALSRFVDENALGQRLVYYRVANDTPARAVQARSDSLAEKLEIKPCTFQGWLANELAQRFDYTCVDNLRAFREQERALTRAGQVRHNRSRHEKDDRHAIDDASRWVLGFDNREKLLLYQERAARLAADIGELQGRLEQLEARRRQHRERLLECQELVNTEWREIDVATVLDGIAAIDRQLGELREGNRVLGELGERITAQRGLVEQARDALDEIRIERGKLTDQRNGYQTELAELDQRLAVIDLEAALVEALDARFAQQSQQPSLNNLDQLRNRVDKVMTDERQRLETERNGLLRDAEKRFSEFRREWPLDAAELDDSFASAPHFIELLERLQRDGLPRHEQRFLDLLKEQSSENLAALNTHLVQARKQIYERMEIVNTGLAEAEFNPGTYLRIEVSDRHLPDVREFREQVRRVLEYAWQIERDEAEARFSVLRQLVHRLSGSDHESERWRNLVLDVRQHVEFVGRELSAEGEEVEVYRSGAGKSGGQREKLATTCLAAALRYQLGGSEDELPAYAAVVLDEAFGKADNEFTELAMNIFLKFGFQMIVATPLKSVMTLEPFIGGACFIDITERRHSATLRIDYDTSRRRLNLPEHADGANPAD